MLYVDNKFSFLGRRIQVKEYICALIKLSMGAPYSSLCENHNTATNSNICGPVVDVSIGLRTVPFVKITTRLQIVTFVHLLS
jgi:hypothetical protein